jgi:hypothetical protein
MTYFIVQLVNNSATAESHSFDDCYYLATTSFSRGFDRKIVITIFLAKFHMSYQESLYLQTHQKVPIF